ncbi:MAG: cytochrome c, partial [Pseudomonadota bacterium]
MIGSVTTRRLAAGISALAVAIVLLATVEATAQSSDASTSDDLAKRGEYLVRAGDCMPCHTGTKGDDFAGGLPLNTPFGQVFSRNITPDKDTGIGDWSLDDFKQTMWQGKSKDGAYLYPTMPFPFYTTVTDDDIEAIWAYLQTLEPINKANKPNGLMFPMSIRESMLGWRELFFTAGRFETDSAKSDAWNRGAYLVEGLGHCGACHTPRNLMGGRIESEKFAGAQVDDWWAPNISTNEGTGVGEWSKDELKTFLKTGVDKRKSTVFGPMAEVVHASLSHLTDDDLDDMATYLLDSRSTTQSAAESAVAMTPEERQHGGEVYVGNCIACHQEKGAGVAGSIPPLAGNPAVNALEPYNIISAVLHGIPATDKFAAMPDFASKLGDQDIADLANYIRTSWGNTGEPNVTPALVKHWRDGIDELPSGT